MAKVLATPLTVLSICGLLAAAAAPIGCGGAGGGTRATGGATGSGGSVGGGVGGGTGSGVGGGNGAGGGGGAAVVCTYPTGTLDCSTGVSPAVPLISDFSPATWANTQGKWHTASCDLTGSIFGGAKPPTVDGGPPSSMTGAVNVVAANPSFEITGTIQSGEYGYGGMQFDKCVNTTTYTGVQFTLGGTAAGCDLFVYAQTFDQQATTNRGGCAANCYNFPKKQITIGAAPVVVHFSELTGGTADGGTDAIRSQIVGLQWQFQSPAGPDGGAQPVCTGVDMTVDDVKFVTD